jgi:ribonucleotide monophosphatase NagD (HAD superfamily)
MPDVGATLRVIEASCDRKAFTIGKPKPYALKIILQDHYSAVKDSWEDPDFKSKIVYIGDNMNTDVGFAHNAGI